MEWIDTQFWFRFDAIVRSGKITSKHVFRWLISWNYFVEGISVDFGWLGWRIDPARRRRSAIRSYIGSLPKHLRLSEGHKQSKTHFLMVETQSSRSSSVGAENRIIGLFVPRFPSITFPSGLIFTSYLCKNKVVLRKNYLDSHHWNLLLFIQLEAEVSAFLVAFAHLNVVEGNDSFRLAVFCFFEIVKRLQRISARDKFIKRPFLWGRSIVVSSL